jgi:hypothetical protein
VKLENRKPLGVIRAIYYYLNFIEKGILDYDRYMKDGIIVFDAADSTNYEEKVKSNLINKCTPRIC